MKMIITLLLITLSLKNLEARNPVSVYISFHDSSVVKRENICRDLIWFRKKFQDKYTEAKVYPYILPKSVIVIKFDTVLLKEIFQTADEDNHEAMLKYYLMIEKMFPEFEMALSRDAKRPGITLTLSQCEIQEEIVSKFKDIHIEHNGQKIGIIHVARIELRSEDMPVPLEMFHIELKILQGSTVISEHEIKKYINRMITTGRFKHDVKIIPGEEPEQSIR